jgi:DNA-binding LytR/AlgR family response regulator
MHGPNILLIQQNREDASALLNYINDKGWCMEWAKNPTQGISKMTEKSFDALFIDMMFDEEPRGIVLAKKIRQMGYSGSLIFITSAQSEALFTLSRDTNPTRYFVKPIKPIDIYFSLLLDFEEDDPLYIPAEKTAPTNSNIYVRNQDLLLKLNPEKIIFNQVEGKYCQIHVDDKRHLVKLSLNKITNLLGSSNFIQVHRNYLINTLKIQEVYIKDNLIVLEDNSKVPLSERFKKKFLKDKTIV